LYERDTLLNDLSVGSALVKPTDFDLDTLAPHGPARFIGTAVPHARTGATHVPALFIATSVLKAGAAARLPGLDALSRILDWWNPNLARTFFLYGGYWVGHPVGPLGPPNNAP